MLGEALVDHIAIAGLRVAYQSADEREVVAVDGLDLKIGKGEFVCLLGPSGCGKSTSLMALGGLVPATAGRIIIDGREVDGPGPDRAIVFQEFALMPWLTVLANVRFGMRLRGTAKAEQQSRAQHFVKMVGLGGFEDAYPHQLSGGMRQRVGIARALAVDPQILLMDEPFGALDAQTRELMGMELLRIWDKDRKTVLFVTHGIDEAILLGDRVVVMSGRPGRVKQDIRIDIPRPRDEHIHSLPQFADYRQQIWDLLDRDMPRVAEGG